METPMASRIVTAKYPNHVWHVDLTVVPTGVGFWCSWFPFALPHGGRFASGRPRLSYPYWL